MVKAVLFLSTMAVAGATSSEAHGKDFLEGFLKGFIGEKSVHIRECAEDSQQSLQDAAALFGDLKARKFQQAIEDVEAVVKDVMTDVDACQGAAAELKPVLTAFKDVHGVKDVMAKLKSNFLAHDKEFLESLEDEIQVCTFGKPDPQKCGEDFGHQARSLVVGDQLATTVEAHGKIFLEGFVEGLLGPSDNIKACVTGSAKATADAEQLLADLKSKHFNRTIADVQALAADVMAGVTSCKSMGQDLAPLLESLKEVHGIKDLMRHLKENFLARDKEILDLVDDMLEVCTFGAPDAKKCGQDAGKQVRSIVVGDMVVV